MFNKKITGVVILLLLLITVLGAFGNSESTSVKQSSEAENTEETNKSKNETTEELTRTYTTIQGEEITIPTSPKRIVTNSHLGEVLKLGVKPVGSVYEFGMNSPFFTEEQVAGIEDIGSPISLEKVTELDPDLIIVQTQEEYEQLSKIAPTVWIPYGTYENEYAEMEAIGELIGKEETAKEWVTRFKEKINVAKGKISGVVGEGETVGTYQVWDKAFYVFGDSMGRGGEVIYKMLELTPPKLITDTIINGDGWKEISLEVLPEYAADHMFITSYNDKDVEDDALPEDTKSSSVYKNVAKENKMYEVDYMKFVFNDPFALEGQLELIVNALLENKN